MEDNSDNSNNADQSNIPGPSPNQQHQSVTYAFSPLTDQESSDEFQTVSPTDLMFQQQDTENFSGTERLGGSSHLITYSNSVTSNNESDRECEDEEEVAFDIQLPYQHLYLARNFQALPGHTYLDEGSVQTLPLLSSNILYGVGVLIPGQTIPLNFTHPGIVEAMRESLDQNQNIFGFLTRRWVLGPSRQVISSQDLKSVIGVTLEIFEVGNDQEQPEFCCKARVTQRFKLLEISPSQLRRQWLMGRVLILSEVVLPHPLQSSRGSNPAIPRVRSAELTAWPSFVYNLYDIDLVMKTAKKYFLSLLTDKNVSCAKIPDDPVQFSFWILINFPMSDSIRSAVLSLNNSLQRLKILIEYFKTRQNFIRCSGCLQQIGHMLDVFSMSASGPQLTYTNPSGFLHETITLFNVTNVHIDSVLSTEYSWFPGYAWKVATCGQCHSHVGWQYVAVRKGLVPKTFFGITKRAISLPGESRDSENAETDSPPQVPLHAVWNVDEYIGTNSY